MLRPITAVISICDGKKDQVEINAALDFVYTNSEYTTVYLKGPNTYWIDESGYISANTILEWDPDAVIKLVNNAGWWRKFKPIIGRKGAAPLTMLKNSTIILTGMVPMMLSVYGTLREGGDLNTHRNVYIHHNVISMYPKSGIGIYGFNNTFSENNVIELNGESGITFYEGDPQMMRRALKLYFETIL